MAWACIAEGKETNFEGVTGFLLLYVVILMIPISMFMLTSLLIFIRKWRIIIILVTVLCAGISALFSTSMLTRTLRQGCITGGYIPIIISGYVIAVICLSGFIYFLMPGAEKQFAKPVKKT